MLKSLFYEPCPKKPLSLNSSSRTPLPSPITSTQELDITYIGKYHQQRYKDANNHEEESSKNLEAAYQQFSSSASHILDSYFFYLIEDDRNPLLYALIAIVYYQLKNPQCGANWFTSAYRESQRNTPFPSSYYKESELEEVEKLCKDNNALGAFSELVIAFANNNQWNYAVDCLENIPSPTFENTKTKLLVIARRNNANFLWLAVCAIFACLNKEFTKANICLELAKETASASVENDRLIKSIQNNYKNREKLGNVLQTLGKLYLANNSSDIEITKSYVKNLGQAIICFKVAKDIRKKLNKKIEILNEEINKFEKKLEKAEKILFYVKMFEGLLDKRNDIKNLILGIIYFSVQENKRAYNLFNSAKTSSNQDTINELTNLCKGNCCSLAFYKLTTLYLISEQGHSSVEENKKIGGICLRLAIKFSSANKGARELLNKLEKNELKDNSSNSFLEFPRPSL